MRRPGGQVEQRAGSEIERPPAFPPPAPDEPVIEVLGSAGRNPGSDGDRPAALELEPERVDLPIVVEPHAGTARSLDEEEKRALRSVGPRAWPEERGTERDDEPHQAGQHLMHLWEIHRVAGGKGPRQAARIARAIDLPIGGDLEGQAAPGHLDARGESGRDGAPGPVARRDHDRRAADHPPPEPRRTAQRR